MTDEPDRSRRAAVVGGAYAAAAFGFWGLMPLYWKALRGVPALEVVAHRAAWSVPVLVLLVLARGRWAEVVGAWRSPAVRGVLFVTAALLALNWLVFVWVIQTGRVLQSSLGYFMNPLVNVALGALFLHERLRRAQAAAVALAGCGVVVLVAGAGEVPWGALALAVSFGLYGLLRKTVGADALVGLTVESAAMAVPAVGWLVVCALRGTGAFLREGAWTDLLLVGTGPVTAIPLLAFANAARRLRLATVGFFQYVTPTCHFLLAVLAFGEPLSWTHLAAFGCIWAALALYSVDSLRVLRRPRAVAPGP